jgi:hypothetical protein
VSAFSSGAAPVKKDFTAPKIEFLFFGLAFSVPEFWKNFLVTVVVVFVLPI